MSWDSSLSIGDNIFNQIIKSELEAAPVSEMAISFQSYIRLLDEVGNKVEYWMGKDGLRDGIRLLGLYRYVHVYPKEGLPYELD